jgi:hypothetical protein
MLEGTPLAALAFPDPERPSSSFSPSLETYPTAGNSYFVTDEQIQADISQWATYPATTTVTLDGNNIEQVASISATNIGITYSPLFDPSFSCVGNAVFQSTLTAQDLTVDSGAIKMTPNHILETIGGDLYFDTELLAKANDIQNIADWSLYPALSTINMNGSNIINAQQIQTVQLTNASGTFGAAGQYLTSDGSKIEWTTVPAPIDNTKNWATFRAVSNVDMSGNTLSNAQKIQTAQLTNASGTFGSAGQYLTSDGTKIEWATVPAPIDNTKNWATFRAVSNVDMSGNILSNAQKIQTAQLTNASGAFGTAGQYLTSDGTTINWVTAPSPGNVATWAEYPANSNVSLPNRDFTITSASPGVTYPTASLNANVQIGNTAQAPLRPDFNAYCGSFNVGGLTSPATSINLTSIGNVSIAGGGGVGITGGGGVTVAGLGGVSITGVGNLSLAGGDVQVTGAGVVSVGAGGVAITGGGGVAITGGGAVAVTGLGGVSVLGGGGVAVTGGGGVSVVGGAGVLINSGGSLKTETITNVTGTGNTLAINNLSTINGAAYPPVGSGVTSLNTETGAVTITSPTANLVVGSTGAGNIQLTVPGGALSSFLSLYSIFVAPNGNDTTGTGSANNPYLTIARAVTARALIANTIEVAIQLFPGTYTPASQGISIPQNTFLVGIPSGEITQAVNIVAQVGLVAGTGTVGLYGLNLFPAASQCVIINGVGTYNITNCNIFNNGGNYAISQSLGTLYLTECRVTTPTSGTVPGIGVTGNTASIIIRDCLITSSGTPSLITCVGSMIIRQSNLINTSTSNSVNPLVNYNPTVAGTTCEISYTTLQYTSAVSALNKICIRANPTAGITAAITNCVNNLLICEGSQSGGPQFHCIDKVAGSGPVTLAYGNLLAGATANRIDGNITKTQYVTVP